MISYQQKLRNMAARSEAPGREHSRVLRLLAETLGVAPQSVSPDAPFAELGLNSLLGVRFLDAVNRAFDLRLGVEALFAHRTAAALARHIETLAPRPAIVAAPEPAPLRDDDIAVIGMAGRFPGAPDVAAFWSLLAEGRSAVGAAPADRRPAFGDEIRAGFLEGVAQFDAAFFGISPREAAAMDPCHRLFLEEAWRAFENAGLSAERLAGGAVGVFVGASGSGYEALLDADSKSAQSYGLTGNLASMIAARVAYALDLKGPSLVVDTACSSSLVAVALACDALRRGEIDLALAGGVALFLDPLAFDAMRRAGMLSPSGACRAFDAASDGIAVGEAAAAVVLKPLRRALADGDRIDAVIKATGTNQDGRSNGVTAPNPQAQTDLMRAVHRRAGVAPETITFVEAHGTGTPLGDPIEVAALREALGPRDPEAAPCWLGSAKASVGHTAEAAGIVGLIKTILCLRHGELPASAHFSALNPKIDVGRSGLSVLTARRPWLAASGAPRRGAVSAFGLSGTNAHAVLEEAPALDRARPTPAPTLLLLSARDAEALARKVADLAAWLRGPGADAALVDVGATLARGRTHFAHRLALIAATPAEAAERLAAGDYRIAIADGAGAAPASNRGDLDAFAAQYLSGAAPEWPTLWPEGRRALDLPGYPFAPTEHWAVRPPSTTESGLRVRLRPDDPLVRDHIVDGAAILHAAVFLDLACRAGEAIFGAAPRGLRDIAWERTIAVPESGIELRIDTAPAGVDVAANLRPQGGEVAARCRLTRAAAPAPSRLDIAASKARADLHMDRGALVGLDRGAARLGPSFAGLDALWLGEDVALGRIDNLEIEPGRLLPLRLSDAIIQTAAALLARADGPAPALRYPVAVAAIDLHAPLPRQASILARRAGPDQIDVTVADDQGAPCLHWSGLTLRRAGAPAPVARAFRPFFAEAPAALLPRRRLDAAIGGPAFAAAFADLSPLAADPAEPREIAELVRRLPSGALILYGAAERPAPEHLLALLKALAADGPAQIELRIAVAPMRRVDGRERAVDPAGAVLEGLAKAAGREHPGWTMIILDVDALEPSRELLLATPAEASGEPVALRGGRRYARRLSPVESLGAQASGLREGGAYLITGGMGRIGREIARHLAEHWRGKLVLVGRRPLDAERGAFLESLRRLGAEADYHALDIAEPSALDPVIAAMKARFGAVHGVIQAAVDPLFARIAETGAADFAAALRPKVAGLREIARATRNETLDFLAVFSSIGAYAAFPGNVGQASYCAACCFEEAFAAELSAAGRPVRLIQWGLWRHDAFAGDGVARLARQGVEAMAPAEAVRAFERIVGGAENRIVHAALGDAVWQAMGAPAAPGAAFAAAAEAARAASSGAVGSIASIEAVDAYGRHAARRRLQERGVLAAGEPAPAAEDLGRRLGALPRHARLVAALAELLARCGETAPDRAALLALEPRLRDSLDLLDHCVAALPDVVAGERQGPDVLFPEGSMRLVEAIHRDQPVLAACNVVMARAAQASGSLRIVEIGAGAGATTRAVLDALGDAPFDYSFTDVSAAFVKRARGLFADPRLRFGVLDIERDPGSQGFAAGGFDLVLATNVLHATRDIAESLRHASSLLKPQGLLLLDEMTRAEDFATLTFGLLDGWWRAEDAAIRLPHSPLLDVAGWRRALEAAGLAHVVAAPAPGFNASASPQTVLLAEKPAAPSPARAAPARASEGSAEDFIRAMVAAGLDMAAEAIDPERPFGEIGVDSIVAPQITEDINRAAGIELRATDLYNFPNVRRLAAHIAERFPQVSFCHPGEEVNQLRSSATPSPIGRRWPGEAGSDEGNAGANIGEKEPPHPAAPRPPSPFGRGARQCLQEIGDGAIAIIGMAGRFPDARDLDAFWDNIAAARCSVREIDRFDIAPFFDATRGRPGKTYAKWAATLPDHDRFDPLFFAISPAEAEAMDPQQRVLLEEAWHALEDAGLTPESLQGARCGVFVGASANSYRADAPPSLQSLGGSMAILSARLSYLLDLKGPTFPVDTGCSSSLTALHLARQSLAAGESDLALAAGVSCNLLSPEIFLYLADAGMASPEGRCKSFDDGADGFAPGEGVGVLVLKRLDDALRDGDRIHALIRGTGINQDGKTSGLTAPSATAQTDLECEVYRAAKVDPATIGLVEAHGTGTKLGDPIEIAALTDAFAAFTGEKGFCAIGSVKTNIGHAMAAAGIAGALKAVLALREKVLPPSLHFSKPNRHIDFASSPFFVNVAARVWASAGPRRAAVSSFSFSGANAHIVLEEAPAADVARDVGPWLFALSAKSEAALARRLADLARWLERHSDAHPADVAFTLGRRAHFRFRRAFVAGSLAELAAALGGAPAPASAPGDLARRYEAGETLDFASRGRLLSLPGYPFERELYWRPQATAAAPALTALAAHWLTRDHVIRGRKLLPGAAFLELARAAAGLETGVLRDVAWRAVVDVTERDLPLRLDVDGTRCTLRAEGTIFATAVAEAASPAPRSLDLAAIGARCAVRRDGAEIYAAAARGGYDYGPAYRVIADVALGEGEALARLAAPADGGWRLHPALLDGAFQTAACIGLADETDGRAYVPFALESFEIHAARAPRFVHARRVGAGEGLHRFDVALCDDAGVTLAFCRGLEARALKPAAAQETLLLAPVSRPLAPPAAVRPADTILAFASEEICARLRASGARVIGVRPGDGFSRLAPDRFAIDPGAAEDYERLLAETAPLAALVAHLWTIDATTAPACAPSLSAALDALGPEIGARSLWLTARAAVRSDAVARLVFATRPGPIASAAAGLARSVLRESSRVACTAIESEDGDLDALARELTLDPAPPVVSLREGQRFEIRLEEWAPPASHVAREDGAIVITGGAGAIGLRVAKHLARSGYSKLALIGRRAPDAALQETIGAIESAGADVLHLVADVSSGAALRAALDKARRRFGSIIGVIHAAGVLHDGRMAEQEAENFDAVWSPKARGAVALDHLTASDPLDFFLLFSSTAARFGSAGQGAYAAANGFFAGFAAWRRSSGRPGRTVAIDWPLWENGAMAPAPEVAAELERVMGLSPMPDVAACAALDAALHADVTELVVLHGRGEALRAFAAAPFRAQDARAPSAPGARAPVEDYLKSVVAEATRLAPARIDAAERFEAYGVDSMMILRMNARLEQDLGALPKTLFFEHQTIADLAARLLADHGAALVARFGEPLVNPPEPMLAAAPIAASADAPIAIIGIAGLYPQARTLGAFWRNLAEGRDCIVEIPEDRWPLGGFYDPDRQRPETSYSKWGGFIDGVDEFDAPFFNISPREADALDPQARKFLEIAWAAMEDSGLTRETLFRNDPQRRGGVFVGVMYGDYQLFGPQEAARGKLIAPNAAYWNIANRVSFWLDMHGPSMAVDTACSSSLSAIHLACAALRNGECSVAFAGGVNLTIHPSKHWILSKSGFASSDGRCRSFGAGGDGYVPGEGVGAVLLKPLDRALADGDRVHAVLRSSAVNHGGRTNGYTVPNPAAHADLIAEALRRGGVAPDSVSYIEAHGTGTALGDPVEVAGLARVFAGAPKSLPIGSVKSNIGHLESAAGIAALTKVALQLRHAQLAPSLHAQTLNPAIDFARTPFVVQQSLAPWRARDAAPRRAGISSFGAGGANAHLVVEEAPAVAVSAPWRGGALLAPLSAATPAALREQAQRLADWLDGEGREADLAAVVRTLQTGREAMRHRALFSTATIAELATALRRFAADGAPPVAPEAGRAWVEGGRMDWEALPPGPRRPVSLPTYAFEKRRCWVELSPRAGASAQTLALIAAPDDPLVADHRLGEAVVLAGAFLLEAARRAGERTRPIVAAEDVEFLRPVRPQMNATIAVEPDGRFVIAVGDTPHARGRLFCDSPAAAPEPAPLAAVAQRCAETIEHESIYAALAAGGAHYGPRYRRLARLRRGAGEILADLSGAWADAGWPADLVDAALQTSFALVSEPGGFAPFSIERLTRWADVSAAAHVHGRRREAGPGFVTLDLDITDRDGRVLLAIAGMTARRVSETLPLRRLRPLWTPVVAEAASTASGTLAVRGGGVLAAAVRAAWSGETRDFVEDMNCESAWWFVETDGVAEDEAVIRFSAAVRALAARPRPPALTVVTRGAWAVLPDEQPDPAGAAVAAFAQSVRREHPEFRLRVVDVDADCTADALLRLPVGEGDFALRRGALWRKSLVETSLPEPRDPWRRGGRYLIVGGAGGIGLALAEHLVRRAGARVALLGRRPLQPAIAERLAAIGGEIVYVEADVADAAALEAAVETIIARFGGLDGAFHLALAMHDARAVTLTGEQIRAVMAPKARGTRNLFAALRGHALDFVMLFSSSNAHTTNPGQSAYAAASAAQDAIGLRAAPWPVKVIDWGFWGEVGRVAAPEHHAALARVGVYPIATSEGFETVERLLASPLPQIAPLRVGAATAAALGLRDAGGFEAAVDAALEPARQGAASLAAATRDFAGIGDYAAQHCLRALRALGVARRPGESLDAAALGVAPRHAGLFAALVDMLARAGFAAQQNGAWVTTEAVAAAKEDELAQKRAGWIAERPEVAPYLDLLDACVMRLPDVLRGAIDANDVLFPGGSAHLVEPIYRGNAIVDHFQSIVATSVAAAVERRLTRLAPGETLRIIEIGGGTGGTTAFLLPALTRFASRIEFTFTDVGRMFLDAARRRFADYSFLTVEALDIERSPQSQGFAAQSFDIVVAANVLHATREIAATLAHVGALLREGGLLLLNEATSRQDFNTLTFGLTSGWWKFADGERRIAHSPLLDAASWRIALAEQGFGRSETLAGGEGALQSVIVAELERAPVAAATAATPIAAAPAELEALLRATIARSLRLAPEELELDRSFADYGADSIISVELVRDLNAALGVELKTTTLFNYSTVRKLAAYIGAEFPERFGAAAAPAESRARQRSGRLKDIIRRSRGAGPALADPPPAPPGESADEALLAVLKRLQKGEIDIAEALAETK